MIGRSFCLLLIISASSLICGDQKPWPRPHWEMEKEVGDVGFEEYFAWGNVENLQPEQVHLSYWGNPEEMWVTWVSALVF